jgi:MarR family transcriptional regulator, organic hydroperoxide resistance regulator
VTTADKPLQVETPWELPRYRNWIAVGRLNQVVRRALGEGLGSVGLDLPHYEVLAAVYRYPGMTQQELADKLLVGRSNLSMLLPEMERRAMVERRADAQDKRLRRLFLTPEGEAQAREGLAVQVRLIEHMMAALTEQECEQLGDMARRVGKFLAAEPFRP